MKTVKQPEVTKAALLARIEALEADLAAFKQHEHGISPEAILRLADIIKADILSTLEPAHAPTVEEKEEEQAA